MIRNKMRKLALTGAAVMAIGTGGVMDGGGTAEAACNRLSTYGQFQYVTNCFNYDVLYLVRDRGEWHHTTTCIPDGHTRRFDHGVATVAPMWIKTWIPAPC